MEGKKETVYYFGLTFISKFITYLLLLILANYFYISEYGKASFALAVFNIIYFFMLIGLPDLFVPWFIHKKDVNSVFYFLVLLTGIFTVLGLAFTLIFYPWILPLAISLPFLLVYLVGYSIFRIKKQYHLLKISDILFIFLVFISVFFLKSYGKFGITLGYSVAYILTSFFIFSLTRKEIFGLAKTFKLDFKAIFLYLKKGLSTALIILSYLFIGWIDTVILGAMSTFDNVARYNISSPIANILTIVPLSLSMFLLTRISEVKKEKLSLSIFNRALRLSTSFSLLLGIGILSLLNILLKIFFKQYMDIGIYVTLLMIGIFLFCIYTLIATYLSAKLTPEKTVLPITIAALLNIILDILLIPNYGLLGICIATLIAHTVAFILLLSKMKLLIKYFYIIPLSVLLLIAFYLGLYGLILIPIVILSLFLFKLINLEDLKVVKGVIFKILRI
ncbi:MAG: polysaccharide biosynthesis C-terminal domain-containing protein [Candidatus Nanoarchaeia archaeon]